MPTAVYGFFEESLKNLKTMGDHVLKKLNSSTLNKAIKLLSDITLNVYKNDSEAMTEMIDTFNDDSVIPTKNLSTVVIANASLTNNTADSTENGAFHILMEHFSILYGILVVLIFLVAYYFSKKREKEEAEDIPFQTFPNDLPLQAAQGPVQISMRNDEGNAPSVSQGARKKQSAMQGYKKKAVQVTRKNLAYSKINVDCGNQSIELNEIDNLSLTESTTSENLNLAQVHVEVYKQEPVNKLVKYKSNCNLHDTFKGVCGKDEITTIPEETEDEDEIQVLFEEDEDDVYFPFSAKQVKRTSF